jgi:hypothetical protein
MNNIELCLHNKIGNSIKLRPVILTAILNLYQRGNYKMTAEMVKKECLVIDFSKPWNERIPAICLSMKKAAECGGRIIGESRDINSFTISFNGENIISNTPKRNIKTTKEKNKLSLKDKTPKNKINTNTEKLNLSKKFKVVIVCSKGKNDSKFTQYPNVNFVATPDLPNEFRPDDINLIENITWRKYLEVNQKDANLLEVYNLYKRSEYRFLYNKYVKDLYILSAGWGLVNSEFKLPNYDIAFSSNAQPRNKRNNNLIEQPIYNDFHQLTVNDEEDIIFIGSPDYIALFMRLTLNLKNRKIIYWNKMSPQPTPFQLPIPNDTFCYRFYKTNTRTNWHYQLAKDLCNDIIP